MSKRPSYEANIKAFAEAANEVRDVMRQFVQKRLRELKVDLTIEMMQVILLLDEKGEVNQQVVADSLNKDKASITYLADNLGKRGLLVRLQDESDRRNKIITLTKEGKKTVKQLRGIIRELHQVAGKNLSQNFLQKVTKEILKIKKNIIES